MKQQKKRIFRSMLLAMGITLALCLLLFPLLLPTENYFRLQLQILPLALIIAIGMIFPLHAMSMHLAERFAEDAAKRQRAVPQPQEPTQEQTVKEPLPDTVSE